MAGEDPAALVPYGEPHHQQVRALVLVETRRFLCAISTPGMHGHVRKRNSKRRHRQGGFVQACWPWGSRRAPGFSPRARPARLRAEVRRVKGALKRLAHGVDGADGAWAAWGS
jgi:hypothetical protein